MEAAFLVAYFSIGSAAIPIITVGNRWSKLSTETWHISIIAIASLVCDLTALLLGRNGMNSLMLANLFHLFQVALLMRVYSYQYADKKTLLAVFLGLALIFLGNTVFFQGPWKLNSAFLAAASLVMMFLSLHFFYRLLTNLPIENIYWLQMVWISFAVLLYYSGNFFQFLTTNYIMTGDFDVARKLWILHNLLNILKNILFTIAIWQSYRKVSSSSS